MLALLEGVEHLKFGRLTQHVKASQRVNGRDHLATVGLFADPTQQVRDRRGERTIAVVGRGALGLPRGVWVFGL